MMHGIKMNKCWCICSVSVLYPNIYDSVTGHANECAASRTADCDSGHATDSGIGSATGCAGKYPDCKLFQLSSIYVRQ
jgi:hypothetical protein